MAVARINGFRPSRYLNGAPYIGACEKMAVAATDATALGVGDVVKLTSDGELLTGIPFVTRAVAGDAVVGVIVGVEVNRANLNVPQLRAASTAGYVYVATDPMLGFEVDVGAAVLAAADINLNANHSNGAGVSATTGLSGAFLDTTTKNTTATLTFKILGIVGRVDNSLDGSNDIKAFVAINNHQLKGGTGTVGIA